MNDTSISKDGTNILPIPPALEFPFPPKSVEAFNRSEAPNDVQSPLKNSSSVDSGSQPSQKKSRSKLVRKPIANGHADSRDAVSCSETSSDNSFSSEDEDTSTNVKRRQPVDKRFSSFAAGNDGFTTKGKVSKTSGRLDISVNETSNYGYLANALGARLRHHAEPSQKPWNTGDLSEPVSPPYEREPMIKTNLETRPSALWKVPDIENKSIPSLNIVIMVIGSRGDIQPFLKIGRLLREVHGHRVRIATHPAFKEFVEKDSNLEFFSVGGDPAELMAFMVKNPGLMPSASTIKAGEIGRKRESMFEMFQGFWRACINATDDERDLSNRKMMGDKHPFVADAIIANPPSFAHIHCAERLGIPLHLMFTFPYSPTQQFPHPLANIKQSNVDINYANFVSYPLVEMMYATYLICHNIIC